MLNITGLPVQKTNFFNRESETFSIIRNLESQQSIYLLGARRIGKTSLLFHIIEKFKSSYNFIYLSFLDSSGDTLGLNYILSKMFPDSDIASMNNINANTFIEIVNKLKKNDNPTVLVFDEFPFSVENYSLYGKEKVEKLLLYHRQIRQSLNSNIIFIYSGETSLARFQLLEKYLNDVVLMVLKPLLKSESFDMIDKLSENLNTEFNKNIKSKIFDFTQGIPFNIQLLFSLMNRHSDKTEITDVFIDEIIEEAIKEKQYRYFQPPQNDSFSVKVKIKESIDLTNSKK